MNNQFLKNFSVALSLTIGIGATLTSGSVRAAVFFAEDLNTTPGTNSNPPLIPSPYSSATPGNTPNTDASESSFLSGLTNFAVETFEEFTPGVRITDTTPLNLTFTTSQGSVINAQLFGDANGVTNILGSPFAGAYNSSRVEGASNSVLIPAFPNNPRKVRIVFDTPINAFGFTGTDIGDQDGTLLVQLFNNGTEIGEGVVPVTGPTDLGQPIQYTSGSSAFVGVTEFTFNEVVFDLEAGPLTPSTGDGFGLDDLIIGIEGDIEPPVGTPEPSALIALGLLSATGVVSRRKRK